MRPNLIIIQDYGPLSEGIQVKASIVLADVTRNGMSIDVKGAQELLRTCERKLYEATLQLADNPHSEGMFREDRKKAHFLLNALATEGEQ
jgi:hypothetical protein